MNIDELQWRMHQHAVRYCDSINVLTQAEKIKHFALRVARISSEFHVEGPTMFTTHGHELFYTVVQFANYFNKSLQAHAAQDSLVENVLQYDEGLDHILTSVDLIIQAGQLAKIAESTDHMEPMNFRVELTHVIEMLFNISFRVLRVDGQGAEVENNFEQYVRKIEKNHPQRDYMGDFSIGADLYAPL